MSVLSPAYGRSRGVLLLAALVLLGLVAGGCAGASAGSGTGPSTAASTTPDLTPRKVGPVNASDAVRSLDAFNRAFLRSRRGDARYMQTSAGGRAGFWTAAEMLETVEDYYHYTGDPAYRRLVASLSRGLIARYGTDWTEKHAGGGRTGRLIGARANDDIMWMVIALTRAAQITGRPAWARIAARNFDAAYNRSWSPDLGGGMWWRVIVPGRRPEKNTTTNATAAIATCELYHALHQKRYLTEAKAFYGWERTQLFNARTGQVYDRIRPLRSGGGRVDTRRYSYNQGTFIGAATLLRAVTGSPGYLGDANKALAYTKADLTTGGILNPDGTKPGADTGGFRGIFARWAVRYARSNHVTTFDAWFRRNAATAWANRNGAGLTSIDWTHPTGSGVLYSFDCSCAVAMMESLFPAPTSSAPW